jgi:hypothetical protein
LNNKHLIFSAVFVMIFSCATKGSYVERVDESTCDMCVNFIEDGKTTKEEVLHKQNFYVLYKMYKSNNDTIMIFGVTSWKEKTYKEYDLVLVFDENDLLKRHSLVRTK